MALLAQSYGHAVDTHFHMILGMFETEELRNRRKEENAVFRNGKRNAVFRNGKRV